MIRPRSTLFTHPRPTPVAMIATIRVKTAPRCGDTRECSILIRRSEQTPPHVRHVDTPLLPFPPPPVPTNR